MKRKTMNLLIVLAAVLLFALSAAGTFYSAVYSARQEFDYQSSSAIMSAQQRITYAMNANRNMESFLYYVSNNDYDYPTCFYLVDKNGEIVSKTGSYIYIIHAAGQKRVDGSIIDQGTDNLEVIDISAYVNEEFIKLAYDFSNPYIKKYPYYVYAYYMQQLDYNIENGKIIPVSLLAADANGDEEHTIPLADEEAGCTIKDGINNLGIELYINALYDPNMHFKGVKAHAALAALLNQAEEELTANYKDRITWSFRNGSEKYTVSGTELEDYRYCFRKVTIDGMDYCLVMYQGQNITDAVFDTAQVRVLLYVECALFLLLLIVFLVLANAVYTKNQRLEQLRRAFTSAVAHELKTPLAIIQNQSECILENVSADKNPEYTASIHVEARRMNALVVRFLQYSRLSSMEKIEQKTENLADIVKRECEKYLAREEEEAFDICIDIEDSVPVRCNGELMALAVDNLLSNAIKYAGRGDEKKPGIKVTLKKRGRVGFYFSVYNDTTEKIADTRELWNLMSRADTSRNRESNSTGMGLPVTAEILRLHHMKYDCRRAGDGIIFDVSK